MYKFCLRLLCLIFSFSFIAGLTGCTTYTIMGQTTDKKISCTNTRVLLTDLTQSSKQRHYLLPDTTPCPNIHSH